MKKRVAGLGYADALLSGKAIAAEIGKHDESTPVNARCDKCQGDLRAGPALLATIRRGVVDCKCGGLYLALHSSQMAPPPPPLKE
jgi:hypothetical protein